MVRKGVVFQVILIDGNRSCAWYKEKTTGSDVLLPVPKAY